MRLKAVVQSSNELICTKVQQLSVDLDPWLDPCVPFMCTLRDFRLGMGGGIVSVIFCLQCGPTSGTTNPNCLKLWLYFWLHFLETKVPIKPVVRRLVWAFVVPMYQRWISRGKVHTIFEIKCQDLHSLYPRRLCRVVYSFRLSVCPFVLSYISSFVRNSIN